MPRSMTNDQIDAAVLTALRTIAGNDGRVARINGKNVREATPRAGKCVYARVAVELLDEGVIEVVTPTRFQTRSCSLSTERCRTP